VFWNLHETGSTFSDAAPRHHITAHKIPELAFATVQFSRDVILVSVLKAEHEHELEATYTIHLPDSETNFIAETRQATRRPTI
jgi:hypothetical protein